MLEEQLGQSLLISENPDKVGALGAALFGKMLVQDSMEMGG
jgi:activator of 2-hydroxyglutaryl-CoA dehydratase